MTEKKICPVCESSRTFYELASGDGSTNYACSVCGSWLNHTPLGLKVIAKHIYKEKVNEWNRWYEENGQDRR